MDNTKLRLLEEVRTELQKELNERREMRKRIENVILEKVRNTCPLCSKFKTLFHLRGGITVCEDCLEISVSILRAARKPISREKLLLTLKLQKILEAEG